MEQYDGIIVILMAIAILSVTVFGLIDSIRNFDKRKEEYKRYIENKKTLPKETPNYYNLYKGIVAEFEVYKIIHRKLFGEYRFFNSVYLPKNEKEVTETDFIIIHENGIFVLEIKNIYGNIYGEIESDNWIQRIEEQNKIVNIYNPIKQNKNHIKYLKQNINMDKYNLLDENIYSIIVFGNNSNIDSVRLNESNLKVINIDELEDALNDIINNNLNILDQNQIDEISSVIEEYSEVDESVKVNHINSITEYS